MARLTLLTSAAFARGALGRAYRILRSLPERARYQLRQSFVTAAASPALTRRFASVDLAFVANRASDFPGFVEVLRQQADASLVHCFDLFGSGPTFIAHGMPCRGIEGFRYATSQLVRADHDGRWLAGRINRVNLVEAQRIWRLIDANYVPLDWQLDFKSGYRWREDRWHRDIRFGEHAGVDVKVPWELARLQHLPALALSCHFSAAGQPSFGAIDVYARELRSQTLDFIATNPPGFGVNWACAMDVAIRAANLLFARDIALAAGVVLDAAFEAVFAASMYAHGRHIVDNLEWSPQYRGNHYLANIVGLLFIADYLPGGEEVDAWLAFGVQELIVELEYQFHDDGSTFEASVCYHRLSAEMVLWAFALLAGLSPEKMAVLTKPQRHRRLPRLIPQAFPLYAVPWNGSQSPVPLWCWTRLARMADFTEAMTRPDGLVVQFGDNDSGRFLPLFGSPLQADDDCCAATGSLNHRALIDGIRSLAGTARADDFLAQLLRVFAGCPLDADAVLPETGLVVQAQQIGEERVWTDFETHYSAAATSSRWTTRFVATQNGLLNGLRLAGFRGMGCYVFRSARFYLAVRCGEIGLAGLGAHAHCDQLAIELVIDGKSLVRDPGTYLYTALPERRNAYRSARVHHVPRVPGREPADLGRGPFDMRGMAEGECLYFGPRGFVGRHRGYGNWVYRQVVLNDNVIVVRDYAEGGLPIADPTPEGIAFSPGYGLVQP